VAQLAVVAVGVAHGQHSNADRAGGPVGAAVADVAALRQFLDLDEAGLPGEHGAQVGNGTMAEQGGEVGFPGGPEAVDADSRAYQVEVGLIEEDRRGRGCRVDILRLHLRFLQDLERLLKLI
jgi:hypothetical protein